MRGAIFSILFLISQTILAQLDTLKLVDAKATKKTKILYQNLFELSKKGIMFGHQDDLAYGVEWWEVPGESDVKRVTGSYPAVYGWDLGLIETGRPFNIDTVNFNKMKKWIKDVYKRGGINTISWHLNNPVNGKNSWDNTPSVTSILPGGKYHDTYVEYLDHVARFIKGCNAGLFTDIPIVFRPFHEHNGNWFWWGKGNTSEEDYISLYRFTVTYLRDVRHVHNLLYAFSPDRSRMDTNDFKGSYMYGYPGDDYVDILGIDNYWDVGHGSNNTVAEKQHELFQRSLLALNEIANDKGKVAALTETGSYGLKDELWFTKAILNPIKSSEDELKIAWILVWRNRFKDQNFTPYRGQPAAKDFIEFEKDPLTLFGDDIQNMYKLNKPLTK